LTPLKPKMRSCHWHRKNRSALSMTPRKSFQRCQWQRWNRFSSSMTPLKFDYNRFSRRIRSHMRNGFRPWIRALGGNVWWKKTRVENLVTLSLLGGTKRFGTKFWRNFAELLINEYEI
jgi:hypothetical protein